MNGELPLPEDPAVDELTPEVRSVIAEMWFGRAASELDVGAQFGLLAAGFSTAPSSRIHVALTEAAGDESRHSEICAAVGVRYAGAPRALVRRPLQSLVRFGSTTETTSLLLHLVLLACVNEATSTFYLRECMKRCRARTAHAALRELLADDVRHARIGWKHLGSDGVTEDDRRHVSLGMPTLLHLSHEVWSSVPERSEPWFTEHGCLGRDTATRAFASAVREVILPGLTFVGVNAQPATRWAEGNLSGC